MTVIEHLEELRTRLLKVVVAVILGSIAAWFANEQIISALVLPLRRLPEAQSILSGGQLMTTSPTEGLLIRLKVTAFAGFVIALPVILWQLWRFVTPGLYRHERRYAVPFVISSLLLFGIGATLCYYGLPQAVRVLVSLAGTDFVLVPRASEYLSFVLVMITAFGLTFEFPLALIFLSLAGVVDSRKLRKGRRFAWLAALIIAAVVTPTADPVTQLSLAIPLGFLYELTILVVRALRR